MQRCYYDLEYVVEKTSRELAKADIVRSIDEPTVGLYNASYTAAEYLYLLANSVNYKTITSYNRWGVLCGSIFLKNKLITYQGENSRTKKEYMKAFDTIALNRLMTLGEVGYHQSQDTYSKPYRYGGSKYPKLVLDKFFFGHKQHNKYGSFLGIQQPTAVRLLQNVVLETSKKSQVSTFKDLAKTTVSSNTRKNVILNQILKLRASNRILKYSELISGTSDAFSRAWNINSLVLKSKIRLATADNQTTEFQIGAKIGDIDDSSF